VRSAGSLRRRLAGLVRGGPAAWRSVLGHLRAPAAFSPTGVEILREPPRERVLVLAPHPDDEIIGPGGTLALHADNGSEITVVYLTDGGGRDGDREGLARTRRREAEAVAGLYGFEPVFWAHPDTRLDPRAAQPGLEELLAERRPDSVYVTSWFEHHFDHYAASAALAGALAALARAGRALPATVLGYEVWDNLPAPNRVVDVSTRLERKVEAMRLYATPMRYTDFAQLFRHRGALHYLLHVDSRRSETERSAEAFLAFGAEDFVARFGRWDERLRADRSPLVEHLASL
jgi:LmbE family N-acetylglucosaminyl deacetylase